MVAKGEGGRISKVKKEKKQEHPWFGALASFCFLPEFIRISSPKTYKQKLHMFIFHPNVP